MDIPNTTGILHYGEADRPILTISQLGQFLSRQFVFFFLTFVILLSLFWGVLAVFPKSYVATTELVVEDRKNGLDGDDTRLNNALVFTNTHLLNNRITTQVEVIKSTSVKTHFINAFKLWADSEFLEDPYPADAVKNLDELPFKVQSELITALSNKMSVQRNSLSSVISIDWRSRSPEKAAKLANGLTSSYLIEQVNIRIQQRQRALDQFRSNMSGLIQRIGALDKEVDQFILRAANRVQNDEDHQQLIKFKTQHTQLANQAQSLRSIISDLEVRLRANDFTNVTKVWKPETGLQQDFYQHTYLLGELSKEELEPQKRISLRVQLETLEKKIRDQIVPILNKFRNQSQYIQDRLSTRREEMRELFQSSKLPQTVKLEFTQLVNVAEASKDLYNKNSRRLIEAEQDITKALPASRVITKALIPLYPSFPRYIPFALLCVLGAAFLAGLLAFGRDFFRGGVSSAEQLSTLSGIQPVFCLPKAKVKINTMDQLMKQDALLNHARQAAVGVLQVVPPDPFIVTMTSVKSGQGQTVATLALAKAFAEMDSRVLVVDANFRKPNIHKFFGHDDIGAGLPDLVQYPISKQLALAASKHDHASSIEFISGIHGMNDQDDYVKSRRLHSYEQIMNSDKLANIISSGRNNFDVILIDGPPIDYVLEVNPLVKISDLVIFTTTADQVIRNQVKNQAQQLKGLVRGDAVRIIGLLNQAAPKYAQSFWAEEPEANFIYA